MDERDDDSISGGWAVMRRLGEGGLAQLLVSKPVADAIGRLVSGLADVPAAYLERLSQGVRDETLARSKVVAAIGEAAAKAASDDPAVIDRALGRWVNDAVRKQVAREDIALRTLEHLAETASTDAMKEGPSSDFMDFFADIAEKASSDALRDMLARVLAGEIRRPGTVSRRTLHAVSLMDQPMAQALLDFRPRICSEGWIPITGEMGKNENYSRLDLLASASIFRIDGSSGIIINDKGEGYIVYGENVIIIKVSILKVFMVGKAEITSTGKELLSIFPDINKHALEETALDFANTSLVSGVEIGSLRQMPGGYAIEARRTVK